MEPRTERMNGLSARETVDSKWTVWWMWFRRVATFLLGVFVILDSLLEKNSVSVGKLVVGLLLIGIPSVEDIVRITSRKG
jgi:hypothetical protein